jgi:hypothetical protein
MKGYPLSNLSHSLRVGRLCGTDEAAVLDGSRGGAMGGARR